MTGSNLELVSRICQSDASMENVKRGKLKLKSGASLKVAAGKKHKKSKKSKSKSAVASASAVEAGEARDEQQGEKEEEEEQSGGSAEFIGLTPAQRRHEEHRRKRVGLLVLMEVAPRSFSAADVVAGAGARGDREGGQ